MTEHLIVRANARRSIPLANSSVHACITSPPYFKLRDYKVAGQLGMESTIGEYIANQVAVFREVRRVLRDDGCLFLNISDTFNAYNGNRGVGRTTFRGRSSAGLPESPKGSGLTCPALKQKDLMMIPARLAIALQDDGWYIRQEIVWEKAGGMPESVRDRPSRSHEMVYLLTKSPKYYWDEIAERTPQATLGRRHEGKSGYREGHPSKGGVKERALNPLGGAVRSVWRLSSPGFKGAHFATMSINLALKCARLGSSSKGCCPKCLAPWRQVIERDRIATRPGTNSKVNRASSHESSPYNGHGGTIIGNRDPERHQTTVRVVGWESTCTCREPVPIPCTIFDPFGGAATTARAAQLLGRHSISTELSAEYIAIGQARLREPLPAAKGANGERRKARPADPAAALGGEIQRPLFLQD